MSRTAAAVVVIALIGACSPGPREPAAVTKSSAGLPFVIDKLTESFAGTVTEVRQVAGYSYFAVELAHGEVRWTASLPKDVIVGAAVTVRAFGKANAFHSKKLDTTFAELWFGIVTPV